MNGKKVCIILVLVSLIGCVTQGDSLSKSSGGETFLTEDGVRISYTFVEGTNEAGVILLHMLNRNQQDYEGFARLLSENTYPVLAFDFRGHGGSDGRWEEFSPDDFKAMVYDVRAAEEFLAKKGLKKVILVGASIGANTALVRAAENSLVKGVVALSPGLEYRSVQTEDAVKKIQVPVLYVASKEDEYSALSAQRLHNLTRAPAEILLYEQVGHGTQMLAQKEIRMQVLEWIELMATRVKV